ncbi:ATP-grasp domain-containing protein [bacterium]|nr:ATP-grasp domain-containing protein [bacterium]
MTEIKKVLVANRGEIACRILRTLKKMSIPGVIVFHPLDADSPAVRMADERVEIDGKTPVEAYLNMNAVIAACKDTGADAVHPGFGFLAENARFAERLVEEGLVFIGPLPETIELMGNKIKARAFCLDHGFPLAPSVTENVEQGDFPAQIRSMGFPAQIRSMGFPVLIKAAAGGGGKGMHIVRSADQLEEALRLAKSEALRSFGDNTVYAERYLEQPRHIEVQVLADHHGNVIHLGERECSIQRRYQKVIEESPAPGLNPELRTQLCQTAVTIARKAGYHNAGTVEFMVAPDDTFYFLEMNTRIQVEHPVTEMVTGVDMVETQIRIARGEVLPLTQNQVKYTGHAIELRVYAEDPDNGFLPATGSLLVYRLPHEKGARVDDGFREGMVVSSAFDPMLAKLIVHGTDRAEAIEKASKAIQATVILGVTTNCGFLGRILNHPQFKMGAVDTGFIGANETDLRSPDLTEAERDFLLAATALSNKDFNNPVFNTPEPYASMPDWRN